MNGGNGTTAFLPLNTKIGGQVNNNRPSIGQFLTSKQARYIYKKTESGEIINTETIQQELEQETKLGRIDDTNEETNPYKEHIVNNAEKLEPLMTQMEQWSILNNVLNYIQYDKHPKSYHSLSINAVNKYKNNLDTSEKKRCSGIRLWCYARGIKQRIGYIRVLSLAEIAQLVEQQTIMQQVLGSIPSPNSTWLGLTQPSIPLWVGKMSTSIDGE